MAGKFRCRAKVKAPAPLSPLNLKRWKHRCSKARPTVSSANAVNWERRLLRRSDGFVPRRTSHLPWRNARCRVPNSSRIDEGSRLSRFSSGEHTRGTRAPQTKTDKLGIAWSLDVGNWDLPASDRSVPRGRALGIVRPSLGQKRSPGRPRVQADY